MRKAYLFFLLTFFVTSLVFSQNTETITISTYYPAPFGVYRELRSTELQSEKIAVGDTNNDGKIDATDQPNRAGDIRLKPQSGDPANWPFGAEGQIAYSSAQDALYINNGSEWVAQGGGGGTGYFLQCGNVCPTGTTYVGPALYGTTIGGATAGKGLASSVASPYLGPGTASCTCYAATLIGAGPEKLICGSVWQCAIKSMISSSANQANCEAWCPTQTSCTSTGGIANVSICK